MAPLTTDRPRPEAVLSHSASHLVSLDELDAIPAGQAMGPRHRPVPHIELVSTVKQAFSDRGYAVMREQYSVSHENARLFGTLDLMPTTGAPLVEGLEGGMAVGLRHANDQAFALGVIAGLRVFVCDNMAFWVATGCCGASTRPGSSSWPRSTGAWTGPSTRTETWSSWWTSCATRSSPTRRRRSSSTTWPWTGG